MKLSQVVGILDARNRNAVPASLGAFPVGSLLIQYADYQGNKKGKAIFHNRDCAYWNSKEWKVIVHGGHCAVGNKIVNWMIIAEGRRLHSREVYHG